MTENTRQSYTDAYAFILEEMDSVPHLEALMLLWNSRPVKWRAQELASRLYLPLDQVTNLLRDLVRRHMVAELAGEPPSFSYHARSPEQDQLMQAVDEAHRRELIKISTMIHSRTSRAVRDFARAFRFKKEQE